MPSSVFEPGMPASERPPTYALERAATGIGGVRSETLIEAQLIKKFTTCRGALKSVRPLLVLVLRQMHPVYFLEPYFSYMYFTIIPDQH
jgi:hypothetical protein